MNNNLPNTIVELFENEEMMYYFNSDECMDNYRSMDWFIEYLKLHDYIFKHEGTQIKIQHPKYKCQLQIDAGGLGDSFSHKFDVSVLQYSL
jgi:guanylate kinase